MGETLEQMKEILAAKDSYFHMSVHDLKGPITNIRGYIDLLDIAIENGEAAKQRAYLEKLKSSSADLVARISDIRNIQLIEEHRFPFTATEIDVQSVILDAVDKAGLAAASAGVRIEVSFGGIPARIKADEALVGRVLSNLIENSIRHASTDGCVKVSGARDAETGGVMITIENRGELLDSRVAERMFRTDAGAGGAGGADVFRWGLGLVFCGKAIEAHGGRIWANQPSSREGASFSFVLPPEPSMIANGAGRRGSVG